jgi:hypothetical protein
MYYLLQITILKLAACGKGGVVVCQDLPPEVAEIYFSSLKESIIFCAAGRYVR